jgi:arabinogalactan oligomer/maltooligosaccharide transport system permease protein
MIFRVMFQDTGYVNQTLAQLGVTQWFVEMGFIGKTYQEAISAGPIERFFHMGTDTFQWLSNEANPWFVRIFLIVLNIWLGFPFFMALMSGVMTSIDKSLYEAASIDGATGFQQFRYITMPLVLYATSPLLVMTFSGNFNNFGVIYFITGGGPGAADFNSAFAGQTDILISWIYSLTTDPNIRWYNMASVFSILIFLIVGSVSAWNFTRTRAFREDD